MIENLRGFLNGEPLNTFSNALLMNIRISGMKKRIAVKFPVIYL
jgi:hypothetical protein